MPKLRRAKVRIMSQMAIYFEQDLRGFIGLAGWIIEQDYMDLLDWQDGLLSRI